VISSWRITPDYNTPDTALLVSTSSSTEFALSAVIVKARPRQLPGTEVLAVWVPLAGGPQHHRPEPTADGAGNGGRGRGGRQHQGRGDRPPLIRA
jgi:hypothetical protein